MVLRYADAGELAKAGGAMLSPQGTITVDTRLNRLLVRDNKEGLAALEKWVAQMDLPVEQVELAAYIVTINEKSLRELGGEVGVSTGGIDGTRAGWCAVCRFVCTDRVDPGGI